jgi:hypothetical protein
MLHFSYKKNVLLLYTYLDRTYSVNIFGFLLIYVSVSFQTDIVILRFSDPSKSRVTKTIVEEVVDGKVISSQVSNVSEVKLK